MMPGPGTLAYAASVAKGSAADPLKSAEGKQLSSMMCWDAVLHCARLADVIDEGTYKGILGKQTPDNHVLVSPSDKAIGSAGEMGGVPEGHAIGFFTKPKGTWLMIHAMVSVGGGKAAGNKNACLGIGSPVGWEVIDLKTLPWGQGFVKRGTEQIYAFHRPLTDLKK
jgi:hypothetical protein